MTRIRYVIVVALLAMSACDGKDAKSLQEPTESHRAKLLLQGVWIDEETEDVMFRAEGDSIYYPDSMSQPAHFMVFGDTLLLGTNTYRIEKQSEHVFWFRNQGGDIVKLVKNENPDVDSTFVRDETPNVMTYTEVVKRDSVVMHNGQRYHWYIAINPTRYKVPVKSYNADGVEVVNVYYDNIMHISVFRGAEKLFSSDIRKQMYEGQIPSDFLSQAVLSNMEFSKVDAQGFHFDATVCRPDGASCYRVENLVSLDGRMNTKLLEH